MQVRSKSLAENEAVCTRSYEASRDHKSDHISTSCEVYLYVLPARLWQLFSFLNLTFFWPFYNRAWWEPALTTFLVFLKQNLSKACDHLPKSL